MSEKRTYPPAHPTSHLPDGVWAVPCPEDDDSFFGFAVALAVLDELGAETSCSCVRLLQSFVEEPRLILRHLRPGERKEWQRLHDGALGREVRAKSKSVATLLATGFVTYNPEHDSLTPTDRLHTFVSDWAEEAFPRGPARFVAKRFTERNDRLRESVRRPDKPLLIAGVES